MRVNLTAIGRDRLPMRFLCLFPAWTALAGHAGQTFRGSGRRVCAPPNGTRQLGQMQGVAGGAILPYAPSATTPQMAKITRDPFGPSREHSVIAACCAARTGCGEHMIS